MTDLTVLPRRVSPARSRPVPIPPVRFLLSQPTRAAPGTTRLLRQRPGPAAKEADHAA
jgi:hypothetical protein